MHIRFQNVQIIEKRTITLKAEFFFECHLLLLYIIQAMQTESSTKSFGIIIAWHIFHEGIRMRTNDPQRKWKMTNKTLKIHNNGSSTLKCVWSWKSFSGRIDRHSITNVLFNTYKTQTFHFSFLPFQVTIATRATQSSFLFG